MNQKTKLTITIVLGIILLISGSTDAQRYMENLGRGVVAVYLGSGKVYVGWRMLGTDPNDIAFNVYRNNTKISSVPITNVTNFVDSNGSISATYHVRAVINYQEQEPSKAVEVWGQQYLNIPLQVPPGPYVSEDGYTPGDASVGDLDGDGEYEIVLKWEDNPKDSAHSGFTNSPILDAYELDGTLRWRIDLGINIREGAHYTQFMVYDLDSDGIAEVACKTAPGTVDGEGNFVILPGDNPYADYRNASGRILDGPEYLTIFDGLTGAELATTNYIPPRGNVCDWGDCYGNRVDRFLTCVAYLDGSRPSLVMCRGYYGPDTDHGFTKAKNFLVAWNWRNGSLTHIWTFEAAVGQDGNINSGYVGQGNHNLSVADVDGDSRDEIIYGACTIDDDGTGLYTTGLGHGDALHVSDMDPDRPGLEVWQCHESSASGATFRDAATGEIIFEHYNAGDVGRACAAHIDSSYFGYQLWSHAIAGTYTVDNIQISENRPPINFLVWWTGDLQRELFDAADSEGLNSILNKWYGSDDGRLLSLYNIPTSYSTKNINGTKANPCLSADILGDWREEIILRSSDNTLLRIFTTTELTTHRIYTLMHDPQYRLAIAWQNVAYNQPPHPSFYVGEGMSPPPEPQIRLAGVHIYGDFNGDDIVDMDDLPYFFDFWLANDCNETAELDLNDDCIVNFYELSVLADNWEIPPPDLGAPLEPEGLGATAGDGTVKLDWDDNNEPDLDSYNLYRSVTSGSNYTKLNDSPLTDSDYTDDTVANDTMYYYIATAIDTSENESGNSVEACAVPSSDGNSITIQENTTGFCNIDGSIDNDNAGYTGYGFANTDNDVGNGIDWSINILSEGIYSFKWRFANGASNRPGTLLVNDIPEVSSIDFPPTGSWVSWTTISVDAALTTGIKNIRLEATSIGGLPNIDYLTITGPDPQIVICP